MQTQTVVPTAPDFLFTLANPDQGSPDQDQSKDKGLEGVEALQHVSHGDGKGPVKPTPTGQPTKPKS